MKLETAHMLSLRNFLPEKLNPSFALFANLRKDRGWHDLCYRRDEMNTLICRDENCDGDNHGLSQSIKIMHGFREIREARDRVVRVVKFTAQGMPSIADVRQMLAAERLAAEKDGVK